MTAAVFHAPMFALNADADMNACAPKPHAVDADGKALARFRVSGSGLNRGQPIHHHRTLVHAFITPTDSHIYK